MFHELSLKRSPHRGGADANRGHLSVLPSFPLLFPAKIPSVQRQIQALLSHPNPFRHSTQIRRELPISRALLLALAPQSFQSRGTTVGQAAIRGGRKGVGGRAKGSLSRAGLQKSLDASLFQCRGGLSAIHPTELDKQCFQRPRDDLEGMKGGQGG